MLSDNRCRWRLDFIVKQMDQPRYQQVRRKLHVGRYRGLFKTDNLSFRTLTTSLEGLSDPFVKEEVFNLNSVVCVG